MLRRCDAIIKVTATCICGSDLHFYNGVFPGMCPGADSVLYTAPASVVVPELCTPHISRHMRTAAGLR